MARYTYIAKPQPHQTVQGDIEAESEQEAINKLTQLGYFPISIKSEELSAGKEGFLRFRKVSNKDLLLFTSQLSSLIESGVNIVSAFNIIYNQTNNKYLKAILSDVTSRVKDGNSLSDSLAAHKYLFSDLYSAMVHTGEASGNLKDTLKQLAGFMEREDEFRSSISSSLAYPLFVLIVGILTIIVLLVFVIPKLVTMFEDMGQALPLPTKVLIDISGFLRGYWWVVLAVIIAAIFLSRRYYRSPQGRVAIDTMKLKTPLFGEIVLKTEVSRLTRTLSLLLSSSMPITPSLEISASVVENQILKAEIQEFKNQIASGASLSGALKKSRFFPELVTNIVAVGEETGSLEKSLAHIAEDYQKEVDAVLKTFTKMLEPVIILVMGLVVGFIVLSMLLPIFQINLMAR
jgi:type II secretion system protein F